MSTIGHFKNTLYCSFCGRSQHEVVLLIAGPHPMFICDACVDQCMQLVAGKRAALAAGGEIGEIEQMGSPKQGLPRDG